MPLDIGSWSAMLRDAQQVPGCVPSALAVVCAADPGALAVNGAVLRAGRAPDWRTTFVEVVTDDREAAYAALGLADADAVGRNFVVCVPRCCNTMHTCDVTSRHDRSILAKAGGVCAGAAAGALGCVVREWARFVEMRNMWRGMSAACSHDLASTGRHTAMPIAQWMLELHLNAVGGVWLVRTSEAAGGDDAPPCSYQGGLALDVQPGMLRGQIVVIDMQSCYTRVIVRDRLCVCASRPLLHAMMARMLERRLAFKGGDPAMYGALKITLNFTYGVFGAPRYAYYSRALAETITAGGRSNLLAARSAVEALAGVSVVAGDTDSLVCHVPVWSDALPARLVAAAQDATRVVWGIEHVGRAVLLLRKKQRVYYALESAVAPVVVGLLPSQPSKPRLAREILLALLATLATAPDSAAVCETLRHFLASIDAAIPPSVDWRAVLHTKSTDRARKQCNRTDTLECVIDRSCGAAEQHVVLPCADAERLWTQGVKIEWDRDAWIAAYVKRPAELMLEALAPGDCAPLS